MCWEMITLTVLSWTVSIQTLKRHLTWTITSWMNLLLPSRPQTSTRITCRICRWRMTKGLAVNLGNHKMRWYLKTRILIFNSWIWTCKFTTKQMRMNTTIGTMTIVRITKSRIKSRIIRTKGSMKVNTNNNLNPKYPNPTLRIQTHSISKTS